jgi:hypothetical protein
MNQYKMAKRSFFYIIVVFIRLNTAFGQGHSDLYGHWKGVDMFQDENSYDG